MREFKSVLVTGGCGFVGSTFIKRLFATGFRGRLLNLDLMTYASDRRKLAEIEGGSFADRYEFVRGDIRDQGLVDRLFSLHAFDLVVNFAAESHVDRSITGPLSFLRTNVEGTFVLLEAARKSRTGGRDLLFHQVSTDEVYGSLGNEGSFREDSPYRPSSPYSASKASADQFVRAWHATWGLPITISHSSNNYGPWQFPEKFVPRMVLAMLENKPLPIYGDGRNVRDWIHVEDHAEAILAIATQGEPGRSYNIGGGQERQNLALVRELINIVAARSALPPAALESNITFVPDRPGHDYRYSLDCSRIRSELGWEPRIGLAEGLAATVDWYIANRDQASAALKT